MNLRQAIILGLHPRGGESNQIGLRIVPEAAASAGTLTFGGVPIADEIVTIGTRVYTFKAVPAAADEIDIGASATVSLDNLIKSINGKGTPGTEYGTGTAINTDVWAEQGTGDTMDVWARRLGTVGDAIVSTTDVTAALWGAGTLSGGVDHGSTPANSPDWLQFCYTSETLTAGQNHDQSERICAANDAANRLPRKRTLASENPAGAVNGELMYSAMMHELFRGAMNQSFVPNIDTAGEFEAFVGVGLQTYTIEKYFLELSGTFENWVGMVLSQLAISIPWGSKSTFVATFMGRSHDPLDTVSLVGSGSVAADPDNDVMAGARDFANLEFDDAPISGLIVQQIDLDINNNGRGINGLGSLGPSEHRFGDSTITGTITMYLAAGSFGLYKDALANTVKKLDFDMTDPAGNKYHVELPKITLTGEPPSSGGRNQDVTFATPFQVEGSAVADLPFIMRDDA